MIELPVPLLDASIAFSCRSGPSTPEAELLMQGSKQKREKKSKAGDSDKKDPASVAGRWNKEEHEKFIHAIKTFGKNWKDVEKHIESRTGAQIRSHAQKFFNRIIKKYNIEKHKVIDFVRLNYNASTDSCIQSPKRKRRVVEGEDGSPEALPAKQGLYTFNEESNPPTKTGGENSRVKGKIDPDCSS